MTEKIIVEVDADKKLTVRWRGFRASCNTKQEALDQISDSIDRIFETGVKS